MTHALQTAIDAIVARLLILEPLSIAGLNAGTVAVDQWVYVSQTRPYWTNKISGLERESDSKWRLRATARLWLVHTSQELVGGTASPQANSFLYAAAVMGYFDDCRSTLRPAGQTALTYLGTGDVTISCPRGLDFIPPGFGVSGLAIDFDLSIPVQLSLHR